MAETALCRMCETFVPFPDRSATVRDPEDGTVVCEECDLDGPTDPETLKS